MNHSNGNVAGSRGLVNSSRGLVNSSRGLVSSSRGLVSIEALVALPPLLLTFLVVVQLSLVATAKLVVRHATTRAARAAAVVLDDDPQHYGGAPRGDLRSGTAEASPNATSLLGGNTWVDTTGGARDAGGARLQAIRDAAYMPLAVLAPRPESALYGPKRLALAVGQGMLARLAFGLLGYSPAMTAVTLHAGGGDQPSQNIAPRGVFTTRVRYLFACRVPIAARLVCKSGLDLALEDVADEIIGGRGSLFDKRTGAVLDEVEHPTLQKLLLTTGHFMLLEATATGVNQGALYHEGEP